MRRSAAVMLLLLAAACSSGHATSVGTTTTVVKVTTTARPTTTAVASTTAPGPTMSFPTHRAAADHLFNAWKNGDRAGALQGATVDVVNQLFAISPRGWIRYMYGGYCDTGEFGSGTCEFRDDHNLAKILCTQGPAGWTVTSMFVSHD